MIACHTNSWCTPDLITDMCASCIWQFMCAFWQAMLRGVCLGVGRHSGVYVVHAQPQHAEQCFCAATDQLQVASLMRFDLFCCTSAIMRAQHRL